MRDLIGNVIIFAGVGFAGLGILGIFRFKNFYSRVLVSSKVDTVGFITILLGVSVKHGLSFFTLKVLFIMAMALIINPLITHSIVRSAYISGYKTRKE